jgi:hypothetical protein
MQVRNYVAEIMTRGTRKSRAEASVDSLDPSSAMEIKLFFPTKFEEKGRESNQNRFDTYERSSCGIWVSPASALS